MHDIVGVIRNFGDKPFLSARTIFLLLFYLRRVIAPVHQHPLELQEVFFLMLHEPLHNLELSLTSPCVLSRQPKIVHSVHLLYLD